MSNRSELIHKAASFPPGHSERKRILSQLKNGGRFERPSKITTNSVATELKKAESEYNRGGDDQEVLHHLSNALFEIAYLINEIGDPQAGKVLDAARSFMNMHK